MAKQKTTTKRTKAQGTKTKKASGRKLSQMDAALKVLRQARKPMSCKEIVEAMAKKKLWTSPGGKTPEATLYASIIREIAKRGKESRFKKTGPGKFTAAGK